MKLFPAIDIRGGKCVRLRQGVFEDQKVYADDPYTIAEEFEKAGAKFIHVVDLDGALEGRGVNEAAIEEIGKHVSIPFEIGGGVRSLQDIERKLGLGATRIIIGTKAVQEPSFVKKAIETFGADKIVVGIDAKNGLVATRGWEDVSDLTAADFSIFMKELGVKTIIYTDISKDGMLSGPNIHKTVELKAKTGIDIIASGGVSGMNDLEALNEAGVFGVIIGKAIYEKRIDVAEAVKKYEV